MIENHLVDAVEEPAEEYNPPIVSSSSEEIKETWAIPTPPVSGYTPEEIEYRRQVHLEKVKRGGK